MEVNSFLYLEVTSLVELVFMHNCFSQCILIALKTSQIEVDMTGTEEKYVCSLSEGAESLSGF